MSYGKPHTYDSPKILPSLPHNKTENIATKWTQPTSILLIVVESHLISSGLDMNIRFTTDTLTADEEKSKLEPNANPA